jgi:hypothetical protein
MEEWGGDEKNDAHSLSFFLFLSLTLATTPVSHTMYPPPRRPFGAGAQVREKDTPHCRPRNRAD